MKETQFLRVQRDLFKSECPKCHGTGKQATGVTVATPGRYRTVMVNGKAEMWGIRGRKAKIRYCPCYRCGGSGQVTPESTQDRIRR